MLFSTMLFVCFCSRWPNMPRFFNLHASFKRSSYFYVKVATKFNFCLRRRRMSTHLISQVVSLICPPRSTSLFLTADIWGNPVGVGGGGERGDGDLLSPRLCSANGALPPPHPRKGGINLLYGSSRCTWVNIISYELGECVGRGEEDV